MRVGITRERRGAAGWKHLRTVHTCRCGRMIRGNAYYAHRVACSKGPAVQRVVKKTG
jgi:hypothetical protein